ncbi:unnamed protein product [Chrysoparadoxa australica]
MKHSCCPTSSGDWLGCCPSFSIPSGTANATSAAAQCDANSECLAGGLKTGLCCPTALGEYLACCHTSHPAADTSSPAACANNPGCEQLLGNCCPTDAGSNLVRKESKADLTVGRLRALTTTTYQLSGMLQSTFSKSREFTAVVG